MTYDATKPLARRQILGASVAGATLMVLPEACSSGSAGPGDAAPDVPRHMDAGCPAADYTRTVNIADAKIAKQGTSYEFSDSCYSDPFCSDHRIILIHPVTKDVYVAMSGACTHQCCDNTEGAGGPTYHATYVLEEDAGSPDAEAPESSTSEGGKSEAGSVDGGHDASVDASTVDASTDVTVHDAEAPDTSTPDADTEEGASTTYTDILFCTCHYSIYNALNGSVIRGPASQALQLLKVSQSGGNVVLTIPKN